MAVMFFVGIVVVGCAVIVAPSLIGYVIREMGGLKALVRRLGRCIGLSLGMSSAVGLLSSIVGSVLHMATTGRVIGPNPTAQLFAFAVGALFALAGGGMVWLLWRWRPFAPQEPIAEEVVARRWTEVSRWGNQWISGAAITFFILVLLPLIMTMPTWLAREPGQGATWTDLLTATTGGVVWGSADYIWRKLRRGNTGNAV